MLDRQPAASRCWELGTVSGSDSPLLLAAVPARLALPVGWKVAISGDVANFPCQPLRERARCRGRRGETRLWMVLALPRYVEVQAADCGCEVRPVGRQSRTRVTG
jgi:hypothetical protein